MLGGVRPILRGLPGEQGIQGIQGETGGTGAAGTNGTSAYVYIAWASDAAGTDFTLEFDNSLDYIAILTSATAFTPVVGDFAGLWKKYGGSDGAAGADGRIIKGYIEGLTHSVNGSDPNNDIDFAAGCALSDDANPGDRVLIEFPSAVTKRLDASYSFGTNVGGLSAGSKASNVWYATYAARFADTSTDFFIHPSFTAPTLPPNCTHKQLVGQVLTNSSSNIIAYVHYRDKWLMLNDQLDLSTLSPASTDTLLRVSTPPLNVLWTGILYLQNSFAGASLRVSHGSSATASHAVRCYGPVAGQLVSVSGSVLTDSAGRILYVGPAAGSTGAGNIIGTAFYDDLRGRR